MLVRLVADAIDQLALFVDRVVLRDQVADAGEIERVAVQLLEITGDRAPLALCQGPLPMRSRAFTAGLPSAAECSDRRATCDCPPRRCRELLAMGVRAGESAEIRAVPDARRW